MAIFPIIVSLFFVFNALGNIPLFVGLLTPFSMRQQRRIIVRELLIALLVLLLFNFFGDHIMNLLGISQSVLGVAGGILLFIIAIGMIFPRHQEDTEKKRAEPMIVPLAIPLVAGPGSMTTVIIYAEQLHNPWLSAGLIIAAWIPTFIILLLSANIKQLLGQKGLLACQKLGGMLVSLIAVNMICNGVTELLKNALAPS